MKISVLLPIYNAEKFLSKSLGEVLNQTLKDIEFICINDGSTDSSLKMIKDYAEKDERIVVIDKDNHGYGESMNQGLNVAKGKYIAILEPDDFVDNTMYETLYDLAEKYNADVVKSNYYEYETKTDNNTYLEVLEGLPYETLINAHLNKSIIHMRPCIWSAIYKREFLEKNHIRFNETPGASYQDTAFAFKVWVSAERVIFTKDAFLHYRIDNDNSSVNSSGKIFSICDEFQAMQSFLNLNYKWRDEYSGILQVLKLDSYLWNLGRITSEYKEVFFDQMALEFLKAKYEGFLEKQLFDDGRWKQIENIIDTYMNKKKNLLQRIFG